MSDTARSHPLPPGYDLAVTLGIHRHGRGDPTLRLGPGRAAIAMRTPQGLATLEVRLDPSRQRLEARAWGGGALWALDHVEGLAGLTDDPAALDPAPGIVRELHRRTPGLRLSRSDRVWAALLPAILEQKVTGHEARRSYHGLVRALGERAPGPHALRAVPAPEAVAALPYHEFHRFGVERKRAEALRAAAAAAPRLEAAIDDLARLRALLTSVPGVGPWTTAETCMAALADADAVSVGDYHLKHHVAFALTGERRGTDEQMLELLEPYRPQRGRVCRLLALTARGPQRRGPRLAPRRLARL